MRAFIPIIRGAALSIALSMAIGSPCVGQDSATLRPGSRVRITSPRRGLDRAEATVQEASGDMLVVELQLGSTILFEIDRTEITAMDISVGGGSQLRKGAAIGGLVGFVVGGVIKLRRSREDRELFQPPRDPRALSLIGAAGGMGLGALVGLLLPGRRWRPMTADDWGLEAVPVFGDGTVGLRVRFVPGMAR